MKKVIYIILLPFFIIILALSLLSIKYSPVYVYRLITLNFADVYDYKHFDNHLINESKDTFKFRKNLDVNFIETLFFDRVLQSNLNSFDEWAEKSKTTALIFIRKDTILYEKYFNGFSRESYFHSQSIAKSFISFLIGAAIDDGFIENINNPITKYIPELAKRDSRFEKISIKNLLEMRSGLKYNTDFFPIMHIQLPWNDEVVGYYHDNVRKLLLEDVQIGSEAGKHFK